MKKIRVLVNRYWVGAVFGTVVSFVGFVTQIAHLHSKLINEATVTAVLTVCFLLNAGALFFVLVAFSKKEKPPEPPESAADRYAEMYRRPSSFYPR